MSIRENLLVAGSNVTEAKITEVLKKVLLYDWMMKQPLGLDTNLGTLGGRLSGGQKQRLALARVLLKNDLKLLILDEATSALDYTTEKFIYNTIFEHQKTHEFTCVIVAHRLKAIKNADQIFVMKQGKIMESGSHSELSNLQGLYFELINSQENKESDKDAEADIKDVDVKSQILQQESKDELTIVQKPEKEDKIGSIW
mmetsp:Transcript_98203/g.211828  ORF Transcript_98203/g.211828 Transcript_98203/m.211828 type:complete len:199 (-) Transcript_98203:1766-2362(-)|eukprot:CAMPEP_0116898446 /NCGR_PEP_ID=MMETSP0467-20121206/7168_1 /TAXON_ID=283647 /ORGANISM="Mesodinium pulex, Strain SPMC105" /LENGTH=198 /DNA_ID=CAMNT_0004570581 /DNA_START=1399 /DNA_END=1995 /DNA_ORIENTATION=-